MEAKFFSEIEKKMDVKTLKDFEKEVRTKIIDEFELLRNKNADLSRVLMAGECAMWEKIRRGDYSWSKIKPDKMNKLFKLIDIYTECFSIVDTVKELNKKNREGQKVEGFTSGFRLNINFIFNLEKYYYKLLFIESFFNIKNFYLIYIL